MSTLQIKCPSCDRSLKLKDRSKLGQKGKCPSCGHSFVLQESTDDEVELELAAEPAVPVGTAARWVPDEAPLASSAAVSTPPAAAPQPASAFPVDTDDGGVARLKLLRQRRAKRRNFAILVGGLTGLVIGAIFLVVRSQVENEPQPIASTHAPATAPHDGGTSREDRSRGGSPDVQSLVDSADPTDGEPIQLYMMPSGVNVVIHLRPAELWSNDLAFQELRATLTQNFTDWLSEKLKTVCRREPAQIEEALIGIILGSRGTEPEFAAVVRLKEDAALSDLVEEFRGEPVAEDSGLRLTRTSEYGYLIHDTKTIAICPAYMAAELKDWITTPNYNTTEGILDLLRHTDRAHLATVLFEVDDVRRHAADLFGEETLTALQLVLDAVSDDAETMSWTMHLGDEFYSDIYLRTRVAGAREMITPARLAENMSARLESMPHDMMGAVRMMNPPTRGNRTMIGRYPAMLEAFQMATVKTTGSRYVRLTTVLPAKAAPNLALATMLTWDESRRTDFTPTEAPAPTVATTETALPETVAERLQLPLDAEFNRSPLYAAFGYIADEIGVTVDLDGDALKDAGYTQNMAQTFNIGRVPASAAVYEIIKQYDGGNNPENRMVIAVDEEKKQIIVLTEKFAKQRGLDVFEVGPANGQ
jgi:hypothetical protein